MTINIICAIEIFSTPACTRRAFAWFPWIYQEFKQFVELVTCWNRESKPCQSIIFLSFFFLIYIENSPMDFSRESQTWTNTFEFENHLVEVRNCTKSESLSKFQGRESLIFQIYITIICSSKLLIHLSCYFGKRGWFFSPGAYAFPTSSVHVPLNTFLKPNVIK